MQIGEMKIEYEKLKHDIHKQAPEYEEELLQERKTRTILSKYEGMTDSVLTQTLYSVAMLKTKLGKNKVSIMLFGLSPFNSKSKSNDYSDFKPVTKRLECILCQNDAEYVGSYVNKNMERAFVYHVCRDHYTPFLSNQKQKEEVMTQIENICHTYNDGLMFIPPSKLGKP